MTIFFIKFFITVFCVIILSEVAKRINPSAAGILMGLPLGSAISSYFFTFEQGVGFMLETIPWGIAGLSSTVVFSLAYLCAGKFFANLSRVPQIALTAAFAVLAWSGFAAFLHLMPLNLPAAVAIFGFVVFMNAKILKRFKNRGQKSSDPASSLSVILFRAFIAGTSISLVTGFAAVIGSAWAGLVGAFPVMMFPLMIVLHFEDGERAYPGVVHAYAFSITNLLGFYLGLFFLLPWMGINMAYLILYPLSALYLWRINAFRARR
jgi:hypothetical protein